MKKTVFIIASCFIVFVAYSQPADTTTNRSPVKTLTYTQYNALINGEDIYGMSLAAELNHYPDPEKVIKFKRQLDLSPIQVNKLNAINKELHRKKVEMGWIIIRNERTLDSIFKYHRLDNGSLIFYANRYGLYKGELRNAILQACLTTWGLLTPQQISRFEALQKASPRPSPKERE
jgi:hypothetical protein